MRQLLINLGASILVIAGLALFQVGLEVLVISWLYADLILPPPAFATANLYDGFSQLYLALREPLALPETLTSFIGQGFVSKLFITPDLLSMNLYVGAPLALIVGIGATLSGLLRNRPFAARLLPLLVVVAGVELVLLSYFWLTTVYFPESFSVLKAIKNSARNFIHDGTVISWSILFAAGALTSFCLRGGAPRRPAAGLAAGAAAAVVLSGLLLSTSETDASFVDRRTPGRPPLAEDYNIIFISIDSLRADHIGAYGYERDTSPTIDSLAERGVRFAHSSSTTSWTLPAHMSMLTGRSILGHGVIWHDRKLSADIPTLAESLKAAGYTTGAITSAPYVEAKYGFDKGFDEYDDQTIHFATNGESHKSVTAPLLQKTAAAWLDRHAEEKFFLFLHYWDVHYDFAPGPPYDTMFNPGYTGTITGDDFHTSPLVHAGMDKADLDHIIALYDGEIRLVDDHIAQLLQTVADLGLAEKTMVVVTSDHGDEFFEHGRKGHQLTLYEEVLAVPMIVYVPGVKPTRNVVTMETSIIDIMPTVLSLVGAPIPRGVEGVDLSSVSYRGDSEWNRSTQGEFFKRRNLNVQISLQGGRKKIVHHFFRRRLESYDLAQDPGEQKRLSTKSGFATALVSDMTGWLNGQWSIFDSRIRRQGINTLEMDEDTRERLKSLGYIQ